MLRIQDHEEKLFGFATNFDSFVEIKKKVQPFSELWNTVG